MQSHKKLKKKGCKVSLLQLWSCSDGEEQQKDTESESLQSKLSCIFLVATKLYTYMHTHIYVTHLIKSLFSISPNAIVRLSVESVYLCANRTFTFLFGEINFLASFDSEQIAVIAVTHVKKDFLLLSQLFVFVLVVVK